jgi:hypothetical protein
VKKSIYIALFLLPLTLFSQQLRTRHQLGVLLGGSYYLGELNQNHFYNTKFAFNAFYRRSHENLQIAQRYNFSYGQLEAFDSDSDNPFNINRNLMFNTKIFELGYLLEINFKKYDVGALKKNRSTPYMFLGLTYFYMNPKGILGDEMVELQPLSTEAQGITSSKYYRHQLAIPFGLGWKANISNRIAIGLEYGLRKTFTDYIDDVSGVYASPELLFIEKGETSAVMSNRSLDGANKTGLQRGNSKNKDWYAIFGFTITYQIKQNCGCSI